MRAEWRARALATDPQWSDDEPCPAAVRGSWTLACAHGHGWGITVSGEELELAMHVYWSELVAGWTDPSHNHRSAVGALRAALAAQGVDWYVRTTEQGWVVPSTWEQALTLYAIQESRSEEWPGIGPSLQHTTGTGRLSWDVSPHTGAVRLIVNRPSGPVVEVLAFEGRVEVERGARGEFHLRHLEALEVALRAIGSSVPAALWAEVADSREEVLAALAALPVATPHRGRLEALAYYHGWRALPMRRGVSAAFARAVGAGVRDLAYRALASGCSVEFMSPLDGNSSREFSW